MITYAPFLGQVRLAQNPDAAALLQNMQQNQQLMQKAMPEASLQPGFQQAEKAAGETWDAGAKYVLPVVIGGLALTGLTIWGIYKIIHG